MSSVAQRNAAAIKTAIKALSLSGIAQTEVQIRKFVWDNSGIIHRGISILPIEEDSRGFWPASCDDIGYNFDIVMVIGNSDGGTEWITNIQEWRQKIRREFINQRLTSVDENYTCLVMHKKTYLPDQYRDNYDASTLLLRCWNRESRTQE